MEYSWLQNEKEVVLVGLGRDLVPALNDVPTTRSSQLVLALLLLVLEHLGVVWFEPADGNDSENQVQDECGAVRDMLVVGMAASALRILDSLGF